VLNSERSEVSQVKARAETAEDDDVIMLENVDVEAEVEYVHERRNLGSETLCCESTSATPKCRSGNST
jgi:hypothetical protein